MRVSSPSSVSLCTQLCAPSPFALGGTPSSLVERAECAGAGGRWPCRRGSRRSRRTSGTSSARSASPSTTRTPRRQERCSRSPPAPQPPPPPGAVPTHAAFRADSATLAPTRPLLRRLVLFLYPSLLRILTLGLLRLLLTRPRPFN